MAIVTIRLLVDAGNHWKLNLEGGSVDRCCFDYGVTFILSNGALSCELRIERPFTIVVPGWGIHRVDPDEAVDLEQALSLLRRKVDSATVTKEGDLKLHLGDRTTLQVAPDENFEAWTLTASTGARLVCLPGGEVAVWPDRSSGDL
jgi:hypothetical protein